MEKNELRLLQEFLRKSYGCPALRVTTHPKKPDMASVALGERVIGAIEVDDEDGDRSFAFEMKLPVERAGLEGYLRLLFENEKLKIMARAKKTDSVELLNGSEFLGIVSADDPKAREFYPADGDPGLRSGRNLIWGQRYFRQAGGWSFLALVHRQKGLQKNCSCHPGSQQRHISR